MSMLYRKQNRFGNLYILQLNWDQILHQFLIGGVKESVQLIWVQRAQSRNVLHLHDVAVKEMEINMATIVVQGYFFEDATKLFLVFVVCVSQHTVWNEPKEGSKRSTFGDVSKKTIPSDYVKYF